jgi:hypothetical protein
MALVMAAKQQLNSHIQQQLHDLYKEEQHQHVGEEAHTRWGESCRKKKRANQSWSQSTLDLSPTLLHLFAHQHMLQSEHQGSHRPRLRWRRPVKATGNRQRRLVEESVVKVTGGGDQ